jgi:hypothetical protein
VRRSIQSRNRRRRATQRRILRAIKNARSRSKIPPDKTWLTSTEVGAILDYDQRTIRKLVTSGGLRAKRVGENNGRLRFRREWIVQWQEARKAEEYSERAKEQAKENLPTSTYDPRRTLVLWITLSQFARSDEKCGKWCEEIYKAVRVHLATENLRSKFEVLPFFPELPVYSPKTRQGV